MSALHIAIASDHGGFEQKNQLVLWLPQQGYKVTDYGCFSDDSVDYPDYASLVAHAVSNDDADFGVLVCGTGIGMMIAANKVKGIRAANLINTEFAKLSREHNNANIATLSGRFVSLEENKEILKSFLSTDFAGQRHEVRVKKIADIEELA